MFAKKILAGIALSMLLATPITHAEEDFSDEWGDIAEIPPEESSDQTKSRVDNNPVSIQEWRREQFGDDRSNQKPPENPPEQTRNPPENPPENPPDQPQNPPQNPPEEVKPIENSPIEQPPVEQPPDNPPNEIQPIENPPIENPPIEQPENPPNDGNQENIPPIETIPNEDDLFPVDKDKNLPPTDENQGSTENLPPVDENQKWNGEFPTFDEMQNGLPPIDDEFFDRENQPPVEESALDKILNREQPTSKDDDKKRRKAEKKAEKQFKKSVKNATYKALFSEEPYVYLLNRESVEWKKVPYRMDEYMIDCWICVVESSALQMNQAAVDMSTINDLGDREYFLQHYLIRPLSHKIQFLSELEITGYAQNAISEREYKDSHWQSLVPGSVEERIYRKVVEELGTKKATSKGHRNWKDKLDEYAHIAIT